MTNVTLRTGAAPAAHISNTSTAANTLQTAVELPRLMDQRDLAKYLGKSIAWCERARWAGDGPQFVKLGRNVRYRAEDVLAWINANLHTSTTLGA